MSGRRRAARAPTRRQRLQLFGRWEAYRNETAGAISRESGDPNKIFDNGSFDWNLTDVKDFAAARYANLAMQLAN